MALPTGDPGCLSLFGRTGRVGVSPADRHHLLAEHLSAEYRVKTEGRGRTVDEWKLRVDGLDNHWLDCLVGAAGGFDSGRDAVRYRCETGGIATTDQALSVAGSETMSPGPDVADDPKDRRGLCCPKCGCRHFRVIYTRPTWGRRIMRRRECRHCGRRMTTWEKAGA